MLDFNQKERDNWVAVQAAAIQRGNKVLDVGAGTGRYRHLFEHCLYRAHDFGIEPSTMGKYTQLDYVSDIVEIPVPNAVFDVVLCSEVLEHVPDPISAVREMARILKRGGKLLLTSPLGAFLHQEPYHFYGGYTPHWYRKFLPEAGFQIESIEPNRGFFSWFGQEARRFNSLISPWNTFHQGWRWPLLTSIWLVTLPACRWLFPRLSCWLDELGQEHVATVGYHVLATKR